MCWCRYKACCWLTRRSSVPCNTSVGTSMSASSRRAIISPARCRNTDWFQSTQALQTLWKYDKPYLSTFICRCNGGHCCTSRIVSMYSMSLAVTYALQLQTTAARNRPTARRDAASISAVLPPWHQPNTEYLSMCNACARPRVLIIVLLINSDTRSSARLTLELNSQLGLTSLSPTLNHGKKKTVKLLD